MYTITIILLINVFSLFAHADQSKVNATKQCYVCTSVMHPGCADSYQDSKKFPHEQFLKPDLYLKSCDLPEVTPHTEPGKPKPSAVGCRKILQEVEGETRVVRQCAFTKPDGEEKVDGLKRTGNEGVRLFYYQCPEDQCNTAPQTRNTFVLVTILVPIILVLVSGW